MAATISLPVLESTKRIGLDIWMHRVTDLTDEVRDGWESSDVHDLRVALRRCRTMADVLSEVNPGHGWRKVKKDSRNSFQALGALRDIQVKQEWLKILSPSSDPIRKQLLKVLAQLEQEKQKAAEQALNRFDRKDWRKLSQKLSAKAQFFPLESVVFQRLALTRLNEAFELYERARKGRSRIAWHRLRIGLKSFRYTLENFMPQRYEPWTENLKRVQDLLGEVHDMDVLQSEVRRRSTKLDTAAVLEWYRKIEEARKVRLDEFRSIVAGKESLWKVWRSGFQSVHDLQPSALRGAPNLQSAS
jgi:CHAD domain-containing protein